MGFADPAHGGQEGRHLRHPRPHSDPARLRAFEAGRAVSASGGPLPARADLGDGRLVQRLDLLGEDDATLVAVVDATAYEHGSAVTEGPRTRPIRLGKDR